MPHRNLLRRLAAFVLLVWLFGVTSGVVNACVLGSGPLHASHAAALEPSRPGEDLHVHAPGHDHEAENSQAPCQRLCDEPAAMAQAQAQQMSPLSGLWLAALPLPWPAPYLGRTAGQPSWRTEPPRLTAARIPIAYLRLAL